MDAATYAANPRTVARTLTTTRMDGSEVRVRSGRSTRKVRIADREDAEGSRDTYLHSAGAGRGNRLWSQRISHHARVSQPLTRGPMHIEHGCERKHASCARKARVSWEEAGTNPQLQPHI
jgi:hypothetical protein